MDIPQVLKQLREEFQNELKTFRQEQHRLQLRVIKLECELRESRSEVSNLKSELKTRTEKDSKFAIAAKIAKDLAEETKAKCEDLEGRISKVELQLQPNSLFSLETDKNEILQSINELNSAVATVFKSWDTKHATHLEDVRKVLLIVGELKMRYSQISPVNCHSNYLTNSDNDIVKTEIESDDDNDDDAMIVESNHEDNVNLDNDNDNANVNERQDCDEFNDCSNNIRTLVFSLPNKKQKLEDDDETAYYVEEIPSTSKFNPNQVNATWHDSSDEVKHYPDHNQDLTCFCGKTFKDDRGLTCHIKYYQNHKRFHCHCGREFTFGSQLKRHRWIAHNEEVDNIENADLLHAMFD